MTIWGPSAPGGSLQDRISRYLSAPLTPVEVRELPCELDFLDCPETEWTIGPAKIRAAAVNHRGPTLGFRITDANSSLCYIPDHEPALAGPLGDLQPEWISGYSLASEADLLIHDCQYTDEEYARSCRLGPLRAQPTRSTSRGEPKPSARCSSTTTPTTRTISSTLLFGEATAQWQALGGAADAIEIAAEQRVIEVGAVASVG